MVPRLKWWELVIWVAMLVAACGLCYLGITVNASLIKYAWLVLGILIVILLIRIFALACLRVWEGPERLVLLRRGSFHGVKNPPFRFAIPWVDTAVLMDMRERVTQVSHQSCITNDNATVDVDFMFYWKVNDPEKAVTCVQNLEETLGESASGFLRAVIAGISLDQALADRDNINEQLKSKMNDVSKNWGIQVSRIEIQEIRLPEELRDAMIKKMAAQQAQSAMILEADGYAEAAKKRADADAAALKYLDGVAKQLHPNTLSLKYLETLHRMGEGESTKYVLPMEFTSLLRPIANTLAASQQVGAAARAPGTAAPEAADKPDTGATNGVAP